jgi:hypothetical protein
MLGPFKSERNLSIPLGSNIIVASRTEDENNLLTMLSLAGSCFQLIPLPLTKMIILESTSLLEPIQGTDLEEENAQDFNSACLHLK